MPRTRRKQVTTVAGELFSATGADATNTAIPYSLSDVIYDPYESIESDSGELIFTAPKSRFYEISLNNTFKDLSTGSVVGTGGVVYQNSPQTLNKITWRLYKNGSEITSLGSNGFFRSDGSVAAIFALSYVGSTPVWSLSVDGDIQTAAVLGGLVFLETGDTLKFTYNRSNYPASFLKTAPNSTVSGTGSGVSVTLGEISFVPSTYITIDDNEVGADFFLKISELTED